MEMSRMERLRAKLKELGADAFITEKAENRRYLSGFTGSTGWVIVTADQALFVTDFRYIDQAKEQCHGYTIINNQRQPLEAIRQQLQQLQVKKLAFETSISFAAYDQWQKSFAGVELVPVSGLIEQLRMIKEAAEVEVIRQAARIADEAYEHILGFVKPGMREIDVAIELEFFMRKHGADASAFDMIVASGVRGALPHGRASEKRIEAGEMVTIDFGALYRGYVSDVTRTFAVGEPDPKMKEIYDIVLQAQLNGVNKLKPGMTGKEGDALTRDIIAAAGYAEAYGHSTGHGIGLEVHEGPALSTVSSTVLEPGMVVTVEPGIYVSGLGGVRIEDDVLITADGCEILTKSTKELLILSV